MDLVYHHTKCVRRRIDSAKLVLASSSLQQTRNSTPKCVHELLGHNYYIPSYQRGYRWGRDEIDDIWDFAQHQGSHFYCLQPLIVLLRNSYKEQNLWIKTTLDTLDKLNIQVDKVLKSRIEADIAKADKVQEVFEELHEVLQKGRYIANP